MPLQIYRPFRTTPEVELLRRTPIQIADAAARLQACLTERTSLGLEVGTWSSVSGSGISAAQLPDVLESIQKHWTNCPGDMRPTSCFVEVQGRIAIHLHPFFLGKNLARGLHQAADQLLLQFSQVLDCIPLAFFKLRPTGQLAALVGTSPWAHFVADFTALGFNPKPTMKLIATISRVQTKRGLNLQVLGFAHGLVRVNELPSGWSFSMAGDEWLDAKGRRISEMCRVVGFTLNKVNRGGATNNVLTLTGGELQRLQLTAAGALAKQQPFTWEQEGPSDDDPHNSPERDGWDSSPTPALDGPPPGSRKRRKDQALDGFKDVVAPAKAARAAEATDVRKSKPKYATFADAAAASAVASTGPIPQRQRQLVEERPRKQKKNDDGDVALAASSARAQTEDLTVVKPRKSKNGMDGVVDGADDRRVVGANGFDATHATREVAAGPPKKKKGQKSLHEV